MADRFEKFTHPGGTYWLNVAHILEVLRGGGKCFLKMRYSNQVLEVNESYEEIIEKVPELCNHTNNSKA